MRQRTYTLVPILDDKQHVIGVFDENSIFDYLAGEGIIDVDEDLQFRSIQKYLSVSAREMEEFLFLRPSAYLEDMEALIDQAFNKFTRVGMAFLTQDGKKASPLFGIVTPWDIHRLQSDVNAFRWIPHGKGETHRGSLAPGRRTQNDREPVKGSRSL